MTNSQSKPALILIVEDEGVIRMTLSDILTDAGYRVIAEVNADHALAVLQVRQDVRVLFTDMTLPGTYDGCALARLVASRWPHIRILVTASEGAPAAGKLPSTAQFVPKPCSSADLLRRIDDVLTSGGPIHVEGVESTVREQRAEPLNRPRTPIELTHVGQPDHRDAGEGA